MVMAFFVAAVAGLANAQPATSQVMTSALASPQNMERSVVEASAVRVALPDEWAQTRPGFSGVVRYQVSFVIPSGRGGGDAEELQALYIERGCSTSQVRLNGHLIFSAAATVEAISRICVDPQLITLPSALLHNDTNQLELVVVGHALQTVTSRQRAGGLSTLVVGPHSVLAPIYRVRWIGAVGAVQWASVALAVLGGVMVTLGWMPRRREAYLAHFGWLCVTWASLSLLWQHHMPWSDRVTDLLFCLAWVPLSALVVQFLLSYAALTWRWVKWFFALQAALLAAVLWLTGPSHRFVVAHWAYALLAAQVLTALSVHLRATWQPKRVDFWPVALPFILASGWMLLEVFAQFNGLKLPRVPWLHAVVPLLFMCVASRLLQVFSRALRDAEEARNSLDARVKEITLEIEKNFSQLAQLRVEQVTENERKRIAADLHDDLGAKLLTIVHTSENQEISILAREALEEMRLSVRGLTGKPMRLADALADWRVETVSRLGQANIEVEWRSSPEDSELLLPARGFVQTTRILRESVSNIIKHSGASYCRVHCHVRDREFGLLVQDNGGGIPMELDGQLDRGHGMASMKRRAKQMQGQCLVESGPGYGTVIRLTIPL